MKCFDIGARGGISRGLLITAGSIPRGINILIDLLVLGEETQRCWQIYPKIRKLVTWLPVGFTPGYYYPEISYDSGKYRVLLEDS
jgi:hypothetical protein